MTEPVRFFLDEVAVSAPPGTPVQQAIALVDPTAASAVRDGRAYVTDGVGRRMNPNAPISSGTIVRVVRSAPSPRERGGD